MFRIRVIGLFLTLALSLSASVRVNEHIVFYSSVDQFGQPIRLSGKISYPANKPAKGLILITHYTIGANSEAPSSTVTLDAKPFRKDYALVIPDYIGYGVTRDSFPPYLDGELTARNCVDMLVVARDVLDSLQVRLPSDSIYVVGFSQGGAASLWTLRLLEEQYADRFPVKKCFAGSGPYDVAATYDEAVSTNRVGLAMTVPLLVMGTSVAYGLNLQRGDFLTPRLDEMVDEYIASKNYNIGALFCAMPGMKLNQWMTANGMDKTHPETQRLYAGLLRSSLVHYPLENDPLGGDVVCPNWTPKTPVYVFHSTTDNVVSFVNAEHLERCWHDVPTVTWHLGDYGDHLQSMNKFLLSVRKQLKRTK